MLNHHRLDRLAAYLAPDVVVHVPGVAPGLAGAQQVLASYFTAFADFHLTIEAVLALDGELIASTQEERIQDEMIVATLDAALLGRERSLANYMLRTRRPELFGEIVRDQVSS